MTQEALMKRKMIKAYILCGVTFAALLIFIGLYADEKRRVQETYRRQFKTELSHLSRDIDSYIESEGDRELRYTVIISDISSADTLAFLIEDFEEEQKTVNELKTCILKYPEQMKTKLSELKTAVDDITADLDKGWKETDTLIESIDKKGY